MHKESIFLIGPMGAGKSTVGRALAQKLGYEFVDSDRDIEVATGATIPMIFDIEGEAGFRQREEASIDALTQLPEAVLATGGGVILSEENRKHLRSRGFVVYLRSSVEALIQRTKHDRNRPLLQADNPGKVLADILKAREPFYLDVADLIVDTEHAPAFRVVNEIVEALEAQNIA